MGSLGLAITLGHRQRPGREGHIEHLCNTQPGLPDTALRHRYRAHDIVLAERGFIGQWPLARRAVKRGRIDEVARDLPAFAAPIGGGTAAIFAALGLLSLFNVGSLF